MDNLRKTTLEELERKRDELEEASDTIAERIRAARKARDWAEHKRLKAEKEELPDLLSSAKLAVLTWLVADGETRLPALKKVFAEEAAKTKALKKELEELPRRHAIQSRVSNVAEQHVERLESDLKTWNLEIAQLEAADEYAADVESAPVMHSLWHRPARK